MTSYPHISGADWSELKSPYPSYDATLNRLKQTSYKCPLSPTAPQNLDFTSIYTDKRNGSSQANPNAEKLYKRQTQIIHEYERQIHQWIEDAIAQKTTDRKPIACSIEWLSIWADNSAFLNIETSAQGEAVRKWSLASLSSAYIHIQKTNWVTNKDKQKIENWLSRLAEQVMYDYKPDKTRASRNNNHQYWAAWSVMITGVITNNPQFYKWGIQNYKKAIKQINKEGLLPLETARQSRALHYHIFATAPLIMMAETAKANGYNLYKYKGSRLIKLIDTALQELDNDQKVISKKTGVKQDLTRTITAGQLAWLSIYQKDYDDPRADKWIKDLKPMKQRRIGGNISLIYSEE